MATMDNLFAIMDELSPTPCQVMSAAKQNRIMVWRDEVASASASYTTTSNYSAPSLVTTTTASSASLSPSELATMSKSSRLWHKVKAQFTGKARRRSSVANADVPDFMMPPRKGDVTRTAMYENLRSEDHKSPDEEVVPGQDSSNGRGRGLFQRQRRMIRASKLLVNTIS
ncbi:hypothetical protein ACSS6W_006529 [Trichoderma asperelloides]|uniref:Uncharacterized protein n=1 Tax=Trichoderma asperellum TaxID=101201 RepID=A0A6V8QVI1_TRIAP|nr:hypothetical protein LI328DRAFT_31275 [Trichoderma asperelloides]GFP56285.1 hypothetical protein TASIC1_0006045500 [Trichoderma asperellum]